jgi:hypothetical protein
MDWKEHGVKIVHAGELDTNTPQTPGMTRTAAITHAHRAARQGCCEGRGRLCEFVRVVRKKSRSLIVDVRSATAGWPETGLGDMCCSTNSRIP